MIRWIWRKWWSWRYPNVSPDNKLIHAYFYDNGDYKVTQASPETRELLRRLTGDLPRKATDGKERG